MEKLDKKLRNNLWKGLTYQVCFFSEKTGQWHKLMPGTVLIVDGSCQWVANVLDLLIGMEEVERRIKKGKLKKKEAYNCLCTLVEPIKHPLKFY